MQRLVDANKILDCKCKGNFSECDTCLDEGLCDLINDAETVFTIPEQPTNGDLIKSIYKNLFIHEVLAYGNITAIQISIDKKHMQSFDFDWWNAPYKKGTEDGQDNSSTED